MLVKTKTCAHERPIIKWIWIAYLLYYIMSYNILRQWFTLRDERIVYVMTHDQLSTRRDDSSSWHPGQRARRWTHRFTLASVARLIIACPCPDPAPDRSYHECVASLVPDRSVVREGAVPLSRGTGVHVRRGSCSGPVLQLWKVQMISEKKPQCRLLSWGSFP